VNRVGSFWLFLRSSFSTTSLCGDHWSLGLFSVSVFYFRHIRRNNVLSSTTTEQMTKAALACLSSIPAVRLVRLQPPARAHAGAGKRSLTSYHVIGSLPSRNKGLFGPVTLTRQRALARCRSHTLSDFYSFVCLFALCMLLYRSSATEIHYFPSFTDSVRLLYSARVSVTALCDNIRCSFALI